MRPAAREQAVSPTARPLINQSHLLSDRSSLTHHARSCPEDIRLHNGQAIPCLTLSPSSNSPVACFIHTRMSPEMELLADGLKNILDRRIPACREEPQSSHLAIRVEEMQRVLASLPATAYSPWRRAWFVFSSSNSAPTTARTRHHGGHGCHDGHSFLLAHRRCACRGRAAANLTVTF